MVLLKLQLSSDRSAFLFHLNHRMEREQEYKMLSSAYKAMSRSPLGSLDGNSMLQFLRDWGSYTRQNTTRWVTPCDLTHWVSSAAPPTKQLPPFRFLDLPPELRAPIILMEITGSLDGDMPYPEKCTHTHEWDYHTWNLSTYQEPKLARVSRALRQEVLDLFVRTSVFATNLNLVSRIVFRVFVADANVVNLPYSGHAIALFAWLPPKRNTIRVRLSPNATQQVRKASKCFAADIIWACEEDQLHGTDLLAFSRRMLRRFKRWDRTTGRDGFHDSNEPHLEVDTPSLQGRSPDIQGLTFQIASDR
ncbi:hypothetical protein K402DRAFT_458487 [Aulographum hederae CBS 113979]|uniref:Uncharacterized protein n=1 Tax=Aulographum hederae CBS 113979 TaxID=1176131 RepID=A0A6G1GJ23_9PEZI|nr:hypothetical protein K402DRAFT_458487 [Aulographum hederae CBS 113979]